MPVVPPEARHSTLKYQFYSRRAGETPGYPAPWYPDSAAWSSTGGCSSKRASMPRRARCASYWQQLVRDRAGFGYSIRDIFEVRPTMADRNGPVARSTAAAIRRVIGRQPEFICSPGTYEPEAHRPRRQMRDCIAYGPGILDLAHQPDEYVVIEDLVNSAKVMRWPPGPLLYERHESREYRHEARLLATLLVLWALGSHAADRITIGMQLEPPILDPTANPAAAISEFCTRMYSRGWCSLPRMVRSCRG